MGATGATGAAFATFLTQSVTVSAGQKVIISAACTSQDTTAGGGKIQVQVQVDGITIDGGIAQTVASAGFATFPVVIETAALTGGAHTITLQAQQSSGTGSLNISAVAVFQVVSV